MTMPESSVYTQTLWAVAGGLWIAVIVNVIDHLLGFPATACAAGTGVAFGFFFGRNLPTRWGRR
jgi:hypothetical protein